MHLWVLNWKLLVYVFRKLVFERLDNESEEKEKHSYREKYSSATRRRRNPVPSSANQDAEIRHTHRAANRVPRSWTQ